MGELDRTYGAVLVGAFVSAVLFGITNLQTFIYFQRYPRDRIWNMAAVCWLWLLDATHLVLCIHMIYWYLVTNYLDPLALLEIVWSFKAQIIVDAIVVISVHTLYTIRLWKLNAADTRKSVWRKLLPVAVSFLVFFGGYGTAIILCYEITQYQTYTDLLSSQWVTFLPLGAATFIDAVIALALCYFLERCRLGSTSSNIDSTITILMLFTLNTGVITSICSLTAIIAMAALPTSFAVISVELILTKLYVNSFLAMFNARNKLRSTGSIVDADGAILHPLSSIHSRPRNLKATLSATNSTGRSDLRMSLDRDCAPALDVDVEHGHSIHFAFPGSAGSHGCEEKEELGSWQGMGKRESATLPCLGRPAPIVARVLQTRRVSAPTDVGPEGCTQLGRARIPRKSAYDVFAGRRESGQGSFASGGADEGCDGGSRRQSVSFMRAQTPSEMIGMALTKDA
ncbi:uncharacterized protein C8Q71DRAFT_859549 [Rhodofomes roseus]|uniref:DUF6534 domain-containing protein n=1 Tax=Rhodofomes roseus TaxID=34475 RepID=A0ABQ8KAU6_9APHY|nr:uncharacterized protein C8Q71DRAFT_859549 [Rhodofomes roseus]KAH9834573.1 hypothetical protein C8Q71DRAFT_859549 [Rhodofomes roseus]